MKASVIIPNLNGAGWLRDSIESIWAQTEQDFELIVIDNGSTDESLAIARSYCGRDRYTLIENADNTGFFPRGKSGHCDRQGRVRSPVQQRRLRRAGLAGRAYPDRRCRPEDFCGQQPDAALL